ncbi:hypothetical protein EX461_18080 [Vibrio parahaemolyticus]|nr:hypothetical protein [Vibrio parahaemolyticus]
MGSYKVKVGGAWRDAKQPFVKVSGSWKPAKAVYVKVGGVWRKAWESATHKLTVGKGDYYGSEVFGFNSEGNYFGGAFGSISPNTINGLLCRHLTVVDGGSNVPSIKLPADATVTTINVITDTGLTFVYEGKGTYYYLTSGNDAALKSYLKSNVGKTVGLTITAK